MIRLSSWWQRKLIEGCVRIICVCLVYSFNSNFLFFQTSDWTTWFSHPAAGHWSLEQIRKVGVVSQVWFLELTVHTVIWCYLKMIRSDLALFKMMAQIWQFVSLSAVVVVARMPEMWVHCSTCIVWCQMLVMYKNKTVNYRDNTLDCSDHITV